MNNESLESLFDKIELQYQELATFTNTECATCPIENRYPNEKNSYATTVCCSDLMCELVEQQLNIRKIPYQTTGNINGRFAGIDGCILPSEQRFMCSAWWCDNVFKRIKKENPEKVKEWENRINSINILQKKANNLLEAHNQNFRFEMIPFYVP